MIVSLIYILTGILLISWSIVFFAISTKRNPELAVKLIYNIMSGIVAGIVVAFFLKFQGVWDGDILILAVGIALFFIGSFTLMMIPKPKK